MDADPRKPKRAVKILLAPLILLNKGLDKLLSKALGDSYYDKEETTQDNIMSMVDAGNEYGNLEDESAQLINNVFEFGDLVASDVMTHRKNIVGVDVNSSLDDIVYIALEKGFSRIPVYKENIDAIVGIIIVKDLLCLVGNENKDKLKIEDFLREAGICSRIVQLFGRVQVPDKSQIRYGNRDRRIRRYGRYHHA